MMVDTNVFIAFERRGRAIDLSAWEPSEEVFISAVTVSELLMGVHRADNEARRSRRSAFVEAIISRIPAVAFTAEVARVHAGIYADLARRGQLIGAHDLIIAATAIHHRLSILTDNREEFSRVPGLTVIPFTL
ncbi:MAG TPA: type II toxin-antitoxin system VapC family toxin [Gemmataceae bacterium]|nr:type II toxin-antitoxin system VapC family toxin [Gemmataceae bacterium]